MHCSAPEDLTSLLAQVVHYAGGQHYSYHHDAEDECFLVVRGKMRMKFRSGDVDCEEGELIVVPKGVEHCPVALTPVHCLLVERGSTLNTGSAADEIGDAVHASGSVPPGRKYWSCGAWTIVSAALSRLTCWGQPYRHPVTARRPSEQRAGV